MTKPPGSSRWNEMFHWCTVGIFISGAKTVTGGALSTVWIGSVRNVEGFVVGGVSTSGKPPAMLVFGGGVQPFVAVEKGKVEEQVTSRPGTRPAAAVT